MVSRSGCDAHTDPIFKELKYLKLNGIYLLQLGQFMYSFSTGNLPTKFDSFFSQLISVFIVTTQGTLPFFGFLSAGQTYGSFLYPFKDLNFLTPLV